MWDAAGEVMTYIIISTNLRVIKILECKGAGRKWL